MNSLSDIRKRLSLSQADLGHALGVTQSLISQYETGACDPSVRVAMKLVEFARGRDVVLSLETIYAPPPASEESELESNAQATQP
jgi:transcriptional regulator with XRE-family HTH domain